MLAWHEAHAPASVALVAVLAKRRDCLLIPAPALVEAYAVMTRLPAPHCIAPADALKLLSESFERRSKIVGLEPHEHWRFLRERVNEGVAGGRTYDALILECARRASANRLLTLDRRDFERLDTDEIEIVVPR